MISTRDRREAIELIEEAVAAGARRARACALLGLSLRTVQRWTRDGGVGEDRRPSAARPTPPNALSEAERGEVLAVCNSPAHASLPPSQIVPRLADQGIYLASESTFYTGCCAPPTPSTTAVAPRPRVHRHRRRVTPPTAPARSGAGTSPACPVRCAGCSSIST